MGQALQSTSTSTCSPPRRPTPPVLRTEERQRPPPLALFAYMTLDLNISLNLIEASGLDMLLYQCSHPQSQR